VYTVTDVDGDAPVKSPRLRVERMVNIRHGFERRYLFTFYVEYNGKIERSLLGV